MSEETADAKGLFNNDVRIKGTVISFEKLAEPIGSANRICERADRCDKLTSDGERCRHGYPHHLDSGCEMGCCAKLPFGAVCRPLPNTEGQTRGGSRVTDHADVGTERGEK